MHGRGRGTHVGPNRHLHSDETRGRRADGARHIRNGRLGHRCFQGVPVDQHPKYAGHYHHEGNNGQVFPAQKGVGPLPNGVADVPHPLVALFLHQYAYGGDAGKHQSQGASRNCYDYGFQEVSLLPVEGAGF